MNVDQSSDVPMENYVEYSDTDAGPLSRLYDNVLFQLESELELSRDEKRTLQRDGRFHFKALLRLLESEKWKGNKKKILTDLFDEERDHWRYHRVRTLTGVGDFIDKTLAGFITKLIGPQSFDSVLDPLCGFGSLLEIAVDCANAKTIHGVTRNTAQTDVIKGLLGNTSNQIRLFVQDSEETSELLPEYDLIINMQSNSWLGGHGVLGYKIRDRMNQDGLSIRYPILSKNGMFIRLVPGAQIRSASNPATKIGSGLVKVLSSEMIPNASPFSIKAVIQIIGSSKRGQLIAAPRRRADVWQLLVMDRTERREIFIAQYRNGIDDQEQIIDNYHNSTNNHDISLGRMVSKKTFVSFNVTQSRERVAKLSKRGENNKVSGRDLFESEKIMWRKGEPIKVLEVDIGSIYLSDYGKVYRYLNQMTEEFESIWIDPTTANPNVQDVLHLKVNLERADPDFIVYWLSGSEIGIEIMKSCVGRRGLDFDTFLSANFYLPSLDNQKKMVECINHSEIIQAGVTEIMTGLWNGDIELSGGASRLERINPEKNKQYLYEDWMKSLPYPLASILWYETARPGDEYREKFEALIDFVEATALFVANIHISAAINQNNELSENIMSGIKEQGREWSVDWRHAGFGLWSLVIDVAAGRIRKYSKSDKHELLLEMYGTSEERVDMLIDKNFRAMLRDAANLRNRGRGHRGLISDHSKWKQLHQQSYQMVNMIRKWCMNSWSHYNMIRPNESHFDGKARSYTVEMIHGISTTFKNSTIECQMDLITTGDDPRVYMIDRDTGLGLKLLSLVQICPASPLMQREACYMYNRLEGETANYVSYSQNDRDERAFSPDEIDVVQIIRQLM